MAWEQALHRGIYEDNRVNCLESPNVKTRAISSEAVEGIGSTERSTTRRVSPNNNPAHERPASRTDEDIVCTCGKP